MRSKTLMILQAVLLASLLALSGLVTPALANETLSFTLNDGADDAEEGNDGAGIIDLESSDLELAVDDVVQLIGVRFSGITIPQGTPIIEAYLQFTVDEIDDGDNVNPFNITVRAQASDDAAAFSETLNDISDRPLGSESVSWSGIPDWSVEHQAGPNQRTPDIAALVQEVVNRGGWQSGNAIAFVLTGEGTRKAESYEGSLDHIELNDYAARLIVTIPSSEVYRVSASDDDAEEGDDGPGVLDIDSSDLEIVDDHEDDPSRRQTIGIRLTNVNIPQGAEILSAHLQFAVDEGDKNTDPFDVTIFGEASGDPESYAPVDFNISSRAKTAASVNWKDIPFWTLEEEGEPGGPNQRTPELAAVVQEIVDRDDWAEGNAMAFIIQGGEGQRTAESFDGNADLAPALYVTFIGEKLVNAATKIRLSWSADPATTMNIIWDQPDEADAYVLYDLYSSEQGCSNDAADYANLHEPDRITPYRGMNNYFANLIDLTPDTAYRFVISDGKTTSDCGWFRTAPNTPQPFTFLTGGDTKSGGSALTAGRWSNEMMAKLRPLFVLFTGDFLSGDGTSEADWQQWLNDWTTLTPSSDGRLYPIVAVHGNHEDGDFEVLYNLFDAGNSDPGQERDYTYGALSIAGDLLRVYNLNSQFFLNGMGAAHDQQIAWLEQDLAANQAHTFKVAGYHKPIRPHTQSKSENDHELAWAALFEEYGLDIAFESDTHNHAITFPLVLSDGPDAVLDFARDDENGVMYVGEGSWGATPRLNNDDKVWTLDSDSMNQFKWNHVYPAAEGKPARWEIRTVVTGRYVDGVLTNFVEGVGEVSEEDLFAEPAGITLRDAPFYGTVISLPFEAVEGEAPLAVANLVGEATSFTDILLTWSNQSPAGDVRSIEIERRDTPEGDWTLVANGLPGTTTMFAEANLESGAQYDYRVRAINVFGPSDWSNVVTINTPVDEREQGVLYQGLDGYAGTQLIAIASASPGATFTGMDFGHELSIDQDTSDYGGPGASQGVIRFDNLFETLGLPAGATIDAAELRFFTTSSTNGPVELFQMLQEWTPGQGSTWNDFGNGIQADGVEAKAEADDSLPNLNGGEFAIFNVTASVQAWVDGADNYGWAIINQSGDGWDLFTEGYDGEEFERLRPRLTIFYNSPNQAPSADAGADQSVAEGDVVELVGSGSDPDGDDLSYMWRQESGPNVTLQGAATANASFTAPQVEEQGATLGFTLTVMDPAGATGSDDVNVEVADVRDDEEPLHQGDLDELPAAEEGEEQPLSTEPLTFTLQVAENAQDSLSELTDGDGEVVDLRENIKASENPAGLSFPMGAFNFCVTDMSAQSVTVAIDADDALCEPGLEGGLVAADGTAREVIWAKLTNGSWSETTLEIEVSDVDNCTIEVDFIDNGEADQEPAAGIYCDPGAPALAPASASNNDDDDDDGLFGAIGPWTLLVALTLLITLRRLRA